MMDMIWRGTRIIYSLFFKKKKKTYENQGWCINQMQLQEPTEEIQTEHI